MKKNLVDEQSNTFIKKNRKTRLNITIILAVATFSVWLVGMLIKYAIGETFDLVDIGNSILDNIIGILPSLILFNFIYEKLVQDLQADEISEQITKTLMGNHQSMELFDKETKVNFLHTTIVSLVDKERGNMIYEMMLPYVDGVCNIRKYYNYFIKLKNCGKNNWFFDSDKYILVQEQFSCVKNYINPESRIDKKFSIGFFSQEDELEHELQKHNYIFREDLNIDKIELEKLSQLSTQDKKLFVEEFMQIEVKIEQEIIKISDIIINKSGIFVEFIMEKTLDKQEIAADIFFLMPQIKEKSKILVSISEPTYSPIISLVYDELELDVIMMPFLNIDPSNRQTTTSPGAYRIMVNDQWLMPMSGAIFLINSKNNYQEIE